MPSFRRRDTMRAWGSRYARLVLERCANNKRRACRELGISYHTLQGYIRFRPEERRRPTVAADESNGDGLPTPDQADSVANGGPP